MSAQQIVALFSRLFALWLGIQVLAQFAMVLGISPDSPGMNKALYFIPLITAIPALLIWFFPLAIAGKLIPRTQHQNVIRLPAAAVAALATATLGLWTVVQAIPDTVGIMQELTRGPRFTGADFLWIVLPFLRLGVGLFLLSKPWVVADKLAPEAWIQK